MISVILSGGSGTRLWPLSNTNLPKQFIKLFDNQTLFEMAVKRNSKAQKNIIICNEKHYFLIDYLLNNQKENTFILEPFGKNTAASVTFCALSCQKDDILLICPSDHIIKEQDKYEQAVSQAQKLAQNDKLVVFGIVPNKPNTGYGYIKYTDKFENFTEKPDLKTANEFIKSGNYYFNSGMICFKVSAFLNEMQKHAPSILQSCKNTLENSQKQDNITKLNQDFMREIEDISIDYALLQNSQNIDMVKLEANWSDLGSFDELRNFIKNTQTFEIDTKNNFVLSNKKVALVGVENLNIIDTKQCLLVLNNNECSKMKELYQKVKDLSPNLTEYNSVVHRPWGYYETLIEEANYKVKKILVKPHQRLSLQRHEHRSEHWNIVCGVAKIINGNDEIVIHANQSVYIPKNQNHRLENMSDVDLIVIETQIGDYLGEDDIIRIEDDYERN